MRGAVPVFISAQLLTIAVTRQVSALNPALRIPPNVRAHAKNPTHKWHIWFCPTLKPTLRKTKRAIFCQRTDRQHDNFSNTFYLEKRYIQNIKAILAA
jgi:hypothetical protein